MRPPSLALLFPPVLSAGVEIRDGLRFLRVSLFCFPRAPAHKATPGVSSAPCLLFLVPLSHWLPPAAYPRMVLRSLGVLAEQAHRSPLVTRKSSFTLDLKSLSCPWRDIKLKFQSTWQKSSSHEHDIFLESQHVFSLLSLPRPLHSLLGTIQKNMRQNTAARATRFRSTGSLFL